MGIVIDEGCVPTDPTPIHQQADGRSGHEFGVGGDLEAGVLVNGLEIVDTADTEPLQEDDLIVVHDSHGSSRDFVDQSRPFDEGFKPGGKGLWGIVALATADGQEEEKGKCKKWSGSMNSSLHDASLRLLAGSS
jgi:hypothetical protein